MTKKQFNEAWDKAFPERFPPRIGLDPGIERPMNQIELEYTGFSIAARELYRWEN